MKHRANGLALAVLLGLVISLWLHFDPFSADESGYRLEADLVSTGSGATWVQYDFGEGWNYRQRHTVWVSQTAQPHTYSVALPSGIFHAFAIVPPSDIHQALAGARILAPDGTVMAKIPALKESPGSNHIVMRTAKPLELLAPGEKSWSATAVDFALAAGVVWLLAMLVEKRGGAALRERWGKAARTLIAGAAARPQLTLLCAAVAAVVVSCYPVIFFGKSFVSPNNGILCLYDVHPTIPGAPAEPVEPWTGSDINATMWEHLPYSVIAHDTLFRDHEFPMWDRYGMCGLTLLGQGMSMSGDPLYWITVAANGASWAWDLRFLISKLLFCFGVGLVIWHCVRHLGIAALLAFSSAFIGYFSYRFNHPAFFGLCYGPWILLCWLRLIETPTLRRAGWWAVALTAANWLEFNSGTAKESTMLMMGMNGIGGLAVLFSSESWLERSKKLALGAASTFLFLAISAPLWAVFLDALKSGYTIYDKPYTNQVAPGLLIGLFDDLFFRQLMENEMHVDPALNFLALVGVCWALADLGSWAKTPVGKGALLVSLLSVAIVFAAIPRAIIDRVPFIQNIVHVDDVFICVAIVPLFLIAGYGLRACLQTADRPAEWRRTWTVTVCIVAGLLALYIGTTQAVPAAIEFSLRMPRQAVFSPFFMGYALALLAAAVTLPWLLRGAMLRRGPFAAQVLGILLCLGVLHFRHGEWLLTKFDHYVVNPQQRVDLQAPSAAAQFVRSRQADPGRVQGFGVILRPGFNIVLRLESTDGVDAVAMQTLAEWYEAAGVEAFSMWWPTITKKSVAGSQRVYDAMNVRYYLGSAADAATPAPGLEKVASADLDVFESKSAWPRAFFTDRLSQYPDLRVLMHWVKDGDGHPFAAVQTGAPNVPPLSPDQPSRKTVAGHDYKLTGNTTSFTIDAPSAGIAVLNESFVPKNFRAYVNGQQVPWFQVNHIFKGVALPGPGTFRVEFHYWPHMLTLTLWISLAGFIALLAGLAALCFAARPQTPSRPAMERAPDA
ncbi:MAG TPA: hypothetical protein VK961_04900 [Chthoniobacter sp.]|nr:hypothetical protein [Chthoniobacter sp.]